MNVNDTAKVLAKIQAFDRRTVGESEVLVWHEAIGDLQLSDCLDAVTAHYQECTDWLSPAHIRTRATATARRRAGQERAAMLATGTAPDGTPLAIGATPTGPAAEPPAQVRALLDDLAAKLSPPDLVDARSRALKQARKQRGRPPAELTKPPERKRAKPPKDHPPPADAQIANQARRYLLDGHEPDAVADQLAVSRKWCRKAAHGMNADPQMAANKLARDLHQQLQGSTP